MPVLFPHLTAVWREGLWIVFKQPVVQRKAAVQCWVQGRYLFPMSYSKPACMSSWLRHIHGLLAYHCTFTHTHASFRCSLPSWLVTALVLSRLCDSSVSGGKLALYWWFAFHIVIIWQVCVTSLPSIQHLFTFDFTNNSTGTQHDSKYSRSTSAIYNK